MRKTFMVRSLIFCLLVFLPFLLFSQDKPAAPTPDDDFSVMQFAFLMAFISLILGGAVIGAFVATSLLLVVLGLAAAGIFSTSLIVGLYKRSFAAGFKTFLLIVCGIGGIVAGAGGFILISHLFKLHLATTSAMGYGAVGGLVGGVLLGLILFAILRMLVMYFKAKISTRDIGSLS